MKSLVNNTFNIDIDDIFRQIKVQLKNHKKLNDILVNYDIQVEEKYNNVSFLDIIISCLILSNKTAFEKYTGIKSERLEHKYIRVIKKHYYDFSNILKIGDTDFWGIIQHIKGFYFSNSIRSCYAYIKYDNKILLCKNVYSKKYEFPGGKIDIIKKDSKLDIESPTQALI